VPYELACFDALRGNDRDYGTLDRAGYYQDNDQLFNILTDFVPFEDWIELHVWASPDPQELDRDQLDRDQLDRDQLDRDRYDATRGGVLVYDRDACEADMLEHRIEALDEGARLQDLCFDAARARLQQLNEEDMLGLYVRHLPPDVDAETLIGRVPDRVWMFSIHRRPVTQPDGEEEISAVSILQNGAPARLLVTQPDGEEALASRVQRWEVAVPVVRELRPGGWLSDVMYVDFLVALEDWCHGEASVAERENAAAFVWRRFNSVFHPSGRDDEEEWRGLQWQEPLVGESEHDDSKWLEATSTDGHTRVVFRFLHAEVRVRYAGPAHFDVAAARRAAGRAREIEEERAREEREAWAHAAYRRMVEERRVQEEAEAEHRVAFDALREEDLFHDEEREEEESERERLVAVFRAFNARSRRWEEEEERAEEEERWAHAAFNSLQQVKLSLC
jgi:hypothetical protein